MRGLDRRNGVVFRVAIKRPAFQFSLARLLGAIGLFGVALSLFVHAPDDDTGLFVCTGLIATGSAIGQVFGKPFMGCFIVVGLFVLAACVANLLAALI